MLFRSNTQEIRQKYLEFCQRNGHAIIEWAPFILHNDPTTLFTGLGMQPLLPYLLGQDHPQGTKLADSQTCLRAQDIEDVDDNRHTTFFEMLGNWSMISCSFALFVKPCLFPQQIQKYIILLKKHHYRQVMPWLPFSTVCQCKIIVFFVNEL